MGKIVKMVDITKLKKGMRIIVMPHTYLVLKVMDIIDPEEGKVSKTSFDWCLRREISPPTECFIREKMISVKKTLILEYSYNRSDTSLTDLIRAIEILPDQKNPSLISQAYCQALKGSSGILINEVVKQLSKITK